MHKAPLVEYVCNGLSGDGIRPNLILRLLETGLATARASKMRRSGWYSCMSSLNDFARPVRAFFNKPVKACAFAFQYSQTGKTSIEYVCK